MCSASAKMLEPTRVRGIQFFEGQCELAPCFAEFGQDVIE
jgi:hypothetical protein